jgi:hypothetical protein
MRRSTLAALTGFVALALVGVTACASGTPAVEWVTQVCGALVPWRTQITDLNTRAQQQVSAASSPAQTRDSLLELLEGAESATRQAHALVVAAGTPDVDGGAEVAQSFATSLEAAGEAYAQARIDMAALSTVDEAAFYDGVVTVLARLTDEYAHAGVDTSTLDSPELRAAFDGVDQCR